MTKSVFFYLKIALATVVVGYAGWLVVRANMPSADQAQSGGCQIAFSASPVNLTEAERVEEKGADVKAKLTITGAYLACAPNNSLNFAIVSRASITASDVSADGKPLELARTKFDLSGQVVTGFLSRDIIRKTINFLSDDPSKVAVEFKIPIELPNVGDLPNEVVLVAGNLQVNPDSESSVDFVLNPIKTAKIKIADPGQVVAPSVQSEAAPANQQFQIYGTVSRKGEAAPGVLVQLYGVKGKKAVEAKTDSSGNFSFGGLTKGTYRLRAVTGGFSPKVKTVLIRSSADTRKVDFTF